MHYFCVVAGKELNCFDCDSRKDPRCHDPFNFTDHRSDMPPTRKCDGCCVKLVQHRGSCKGLHHFYNSTIFSFYCQLMKQSEELAQTRLTSTCSWWIMSVWLKEVVTEYLSDLIIVFLFSREATLELALSVRYHSLKILNPVSSSVKIKRQKQASKSSVKIKRQNQESKSSVKIKHQNQASKASIKFKHQNQVSKSSVKIKRQNQASKSSVKIKHQNQVSKVKCQNQASKSS